MIVKKDYIVINYRNPFLTPFLFVLIISLVWGCSKVDPHIKDVLSKYLDASFYGEFEEAYKFISTSDKETKSLQEYLAEKSEEKSFMEAFADMITYKIKEVKALDDRAKAKVIITMPNFEIIFPDIVGTALMSALERKKNNKDIKDMLIEKYKKEKREIPMVKAVQVFDLVKEEDGWKVFLNWRHQK